MSSIDPTCDLDLERLSHRPLELIIDPGSQELSTARLDMLMVTIGGIVLSAILIVCGVKWNLSWTGIPAATIITGICATNGTIYFASTRKGYRCNCEDKE